MIKPSILLALFLGIIFAQMIPAHPEDSRKSSDEDEGENEEDDGPALTCILFNNLGCNTECSTIASAFAINGSGKCTQKYTCKCTLEDDSLEGLFRAKFKGKGAETALEEIKKDENLAEDVLDVLQEPFQTAEQTKKQLKEVISPDIYDQLTINDETPVSTRNLVGETESLNLKNIRDYVAEKLKPVLKSSAKQLKDINYVLNLKKSLNSKDLQSIVKEVRRTKNRKLSAIVDAHLKAARIRENPSTEKETLADAMGHIIIDTFVNEIEKNKKPSANKQTRKISPAKGRGRKKPIDEETKNVDASSNRFQLPGFKKDSLKKYVGSIDETFQGAEYTLHYQRSKEGSIHFVWKKNSDVVDISVSSEGYVSQNWLLDDAKIRVSRNWSDGSFDEVWDFGTCKRWYSKSAEGEITAGSTHGRKSLGPLQKYQALIEEWCNENDFLFTNPKDCSIYDKSYIRHS